MILLILQIGLRAGNDLRDLGVHYEHLSQLERLDLDAALQVELMNLRHTIETFRDESLI